METHKQEKAETQHPSTVWAIKKLLGSRLVFVFLVFREKLNGTVRA